MNDLVSIRLAANDGVISAAELLCAGVDEHQVRALVSRGALVRVRSGAFVDGARWADADACSRHVLGTRSMVRRLDRYAVSHLSAVALWGLPVIADDLGSVHVVMVG
ncbi:MAG: type IV toxin-antitoxin system AbiEi family antitoxin domain-containing protein, partial [Lapillicoccus sp.]